MGFWMIPDNCSDICLRVDSGTCVSEMARMGMRELMRFMPLSTFRPSDP